MRDPAGPDQHSLYFLIFLVLQEVLEEVQPILNPKTEPHFGYPTLDTNNYEKESSM
jgi:hypothetical protein